MKNSAKEQKFLNLVDYKIWKDVCMSYMRKVQRLSLNGSTLKRVETGAKII